MKTTNPVNQLEQTRAFVSSHGYDAWIEGAAVCFTRHSRNMFDYSWTTSIEQVHTVAQARNALCVGA